MKAITVLGVGNILWKDEGFGVRVIEALEREYGFPEQVQVLDGGTLGMELLPFLKGVRKLLIVDAVDGDGVPGTLYRLVGGQVDMYFQEKLSVHELGVKDVLAALSVIDEPMEEVVVLGVQPASLEMGLELSPQVAVMINITMEAALSQLAKWQVKAWKV